MPAVDCKCTRQTVQRAYYSGSSVRKIHLFCKVHKIRLCACIAEIHRRMDKDVSVSKKYVQKYS